MSLVDSQGVIRVALEKYTFHHNLMCRSIFLLDTEEAHRRAGPVDNTGLWNKHEKGGVTMDLCAGLIYVVMMIAIWIYEWREEHNK
jgi:hypothetical protein